MTLAATNHPGGGDFSMGFSWFIVMKNCYPPTPAFAKAGAAPGITAGVELVFLSNRHPKATSMASSGRPSLPFARP